MDTTRRIETEEDARAWLVEHIATPAEAAPQLQSRIDAAASTLVEALTAYVGSYRTDRRPGAGRRSFASPGKREGQRPADK